ncbi:MAG: hypothetical protein E7520_05795 [Ruminococcaceae bacterium]|nr:hypothetical protein [Oscillospiraceae bacterium]
MRKINDSALALGLTAVIVMLIYLSSEAKAGAETGISLCEGVIIPALLPVLMISNILLTSRASRFFERLCGGVFRHLLKLPESAVTPVLFGLVAGYPSGAVLTLEQYKAGALSDEEAGRMMRFNLCGGAAFIITAVGNGYYGSTKIGTLLYLISLTSNMMIALFSAFLFRGAVHRSERRRALPFSDALCRSAETASRSVILMSAYIILFCALVRIAKPPPFLTPVLEITSGIFTAGSKIPLPFCAAFLSFGGICIHLQLIGMLSEMKVKYAEFFLFRVLAAVLSYGMGKLYLLFFPDAVAVFSALSDEVTVRFTEAHTALGVLAMLGCAMLVIEIENRKIRL